MTAEWTRAYFTVIRTDDALNIASSAVTTAAAARQTAPSRNQ